jgi:hypothetical protein
MGVAFAAETPPDAGVSPPTAVEDEEVAAVLAAAEAAAARRSMPPAVMLPSSAASSADEAEEPTSSISIRNLVEESSLVAIRAVEKILVESRQPERTRW